jgi:hypothetical protein
MNEEINNDNHQVKDKLPLANDEKKPSSFWQRVERFILICTFIFALTGTLYSVLTAQKALEQYSIDLRPWISTPKVETYFKPDRLETRFEITNIGKVPAYMTVEACAHRNGNLVKQKQPNQMGQTFSIMPGQKIYFVGFGMKGDTYEKLLNHQFEEEVTQSIDIKYDTNKNDTKRYWTYSKIKFDIKDLPPQLQNSQAVGVWDIVESDFK